MTGEDISGGMKDKLSSVEMTESTPDEAKDNKKVSAYLQDKLDNLPASPGVYLYKNSEEKIIYVGKAKVLRNRVRSYFTGRTDGRSQFESLVRSISDFEIIVTYSEVEALILEANLIKRYNPRFNIFFRDDKFFPFLKVTKEKFPQVFTTRKVLDDGASYYGPFTEVKQVKRLIKTFKEIFQIRNCKYLITEESIALGKHELCLDYHIGLCGGACRGLVEEEIYNDNVKKLVRMVKGNVSGVISDLRRDMASAADNLRFEEAARLRDRLKVVEDFAARQTIISNDVIDRDVFGVSVEDDDGCIAVLRVREGRMQGREHFFLKRTSEKTKSEIIGSFISMFYLQSDFVPRQLYLPEVPEDEETLIKWLRQKRDGAVDFIYPQRGSKVKLLGLALSNAELLLGERRRKSEVRDKVSHSVTALQEGLNLKSMPNVIEAFDISNTQGAQPVASLVMFKNGREFKSGYRKFNIKNVEGINDFAMMAEAVHRRYSRVIKENEALPDLIMVDGGKGQLSSAVKVLHELQLQDIPVIGLAKRLDEVFIPGDPEPIFLPRTSSALKLLQRIRDEAHRTAVTHHRKRRGKHETDSILDQIPGIGDARKFALYKRFGSIRNIAEADIESLLSVKEIDSRSAEEIRKYFSKEKI